MVLKDVVSGDEKPEKIEVLLFAGMPLIENTIYLNNKIADYTYKDHMLTIPVTQKEGTITFQFDSASGWKVSSIARMVFQGSDTKRLLAYYQSETQSLSLAANTVISEETFTVRGYAPAESTVSLYYKNFDASPGNITI